MRGIGDLELFITDENANFTNKVTSKPLEDGADISDHIYQNPVELSVDFVVTRNGQEIAEKLIEMRDSSQVYKYSGVDFNFANMAIKSLKIPRNKDIKNGFNGSITLKQVRVSDSSSGPTPGPGVQMSRKETPKRELGDS